MEQGKNIVKKFLENFFISELMDEQNKMKSFRSDQSTEEAKQHQ